MTQDQNFYDTAISLIRTALAAREEAAQYIEMIEDEELKKLAEKFYDEL